MASAGASPAPRWATNCAQLIGLLFALAIFLQPYYRRRYHTHLTWHPHARRLWAQLRLGVPMGLPPAADLLGFAIFQMMQTWLGTVGRRRHADGR